MLSIVMKPARLYAFSVSPYWERAISLLNNRNGIHTVKGQEFHKIILQDILKDDQPHFIQEAKASLKTLEENGLDELIRLIIEADSAKLYPEEFKTQSNITRYNNALINTKDFLNLIVSAGIRDIRDLDHLGGNDLVYDIDRKEPNIKRSQRRENQRQLLSEPDLFQAALVGFLKLDTEIQTELFEFIKVLRFVKEHALAISEKIVNPPEDKKPKIIPYTED